MQLHRSLINLQDLQDFARVASRRYDFVAAGVLRFQQEVDVAAEAVLLGVLHLGLEDFHLVGFAD